MPARACRPQGEASADRGPERTGGRRRWEKSQDQRSRHRDSTTPTDRRHSAWRGSGSCVGGCARDPVSVGMCPCPPVEEVVPEWVVSVSVFIDTRTHLRSPCPRTHPDTPDTPDTSPAVGRRRGVPQSVGALALDQQPAGAGRPSRDGGTRDGPWGGRAGIESVGAYTRPQQVEAEPIMVGSATP